MKKMKDIRSFFAFPKTSNNERSEETHEEPIPSTSAKENKNSSLENEQEGERGIEDYKRRYTSPLSCTTTDQLMEEAKQSNLESGQEMERANVFENSKTVASNITLPPCTSAVNSAVIFRNQDNGQKSSTDLGTLQTGPAQPHTVFPRTKFGNKLRAFSAQHYEKYSWLEYSVQEDKIYCFVCRHFSKETTRDQNERFVKSGFNNWKKMSEALLKHAQSTIHTRCTEMHIAHQHHQQSNVYDKVISQHEQEVIQNRKNLIKIIDVILLLVRQGLPLRGHREDEASENRGNFLETAEVFANHNENLSKHLNNHIKYCSPKIQNEVIAIIYQTMLKEIVKEVKECGFFSLMVDEARCYKEQQLSIVIRYAKNLEIVERFLAFIDCSNSRDANSLASLILNFLNGCGLEKIPILAQSYDGASVMSGKHKGLQSIIKEIYPHAIYVHCLAHRLNLVIVDACLNISSATAFFNTLEALHIHFSQPGHHSNLRKIQDALGIKSGREMGTLSGTRWSCRYENCKSVLNNYTAIKSALENEISQNVDKFAIEAIGLMTCIRKPEFVVCLHIFNSVLLKINVLSKFFQSKTATLGKASELIKGIITTFEKDRNDFEDMWFQIKEFAQTEEIALEPTRVNKRKCRQQVKEYADFIVDSTLGKEPFLNLPSDNSSEYWKINIHYQVMDNIIMNLKNRFQCLPLAQSVDAFTKLDFEDAESFINNYKVVLNIDVSALQAEMTVLKNMVKSKFKEVTFENLEKCVQKDFYPNLFQMLQAMIVLPVSSAGCERSFSTMRRIKTWLRTCMTQERFSNLALINIEKTFCKNKVTAESVLKVFSEKNRKLKLI